MQSCTRHLGGKKFECFAGGHRIVTDQPSPDGGIGAGPTPPELLLASLGACAGHYAAEYLQARSLPANGLRVFVTASKGEHPARLSKFGIEVDVPVGIDERQREGLLRSVKKCLIHNTLTSLPAVEVQVSEASHEVCLQNCTSLEVLR